MVRHTSLEKRFNSLKKTDPRNAAEHAYVLAMLYKRAGNKKRAIQFGRESIALFNKCRMETMEDCAAQNTVIRGIVLPDLIHQEVVRDRLRPLSL